MDVFDTRKITARSTRVMGDFAVAIPEEPSVAAPDWIGYRASLARIARRAADAAAPVVCAGCGTELDVAEVVHSPRCEELSSGVTRPAHGWDVESALGALRRWVEERGEIPRSDEWNRGNATHPGFGRVAVLFGSWREFILAAGLEPRKSGGGRRPRTGPRSTPAQKAAAEQAAEERRASYVEDGLVDPDELYG